MEPIGLNRQFRPRERMNTSGMFRTPVGGGDVGLVQGPVTPERGLTYPLTITNASVELFPVDLSRKFLYIVNFDTLGVVWLSFGGAGAVLNQGFRLAPGGGAVLLDMNVPTARIFAIGTIASNANVSAVVA